VQYFAVKTITRKDYDDPKLYDLLLYMSLLSIDKAEELICRLIKG